MHSLSIYDKPDLQAEGQMTIEQLIDRPDRLVGMHRIFARAIKQMNLAEWKTVVYALTKINFMEEAKINLRLDHSNSINYVYQGDKIREICQHKVEDKNNIEIKALEHINESNNLVCLKCGEKVKLNKEKLKR